MHPAQLEHATDLVSCDDLLFLWQDIEGTAPSLDSKRELKCETTLIHACLALGEYKSNLGYNMHPYQLSQDSCQMYYL